MIMVDEIQTWPHARAYGNAIVAPLAAEFVGAVIDSLIDDASRAS